MIPIPKPLDKTFKLPKILTILALVRGSWEQEGREVAAPRKQVAFSALLFPKKL